MPPQQQQGRQDQGSSDFIWMTVAIVLVTAGLWFFFGNQITHFFYQVRIYELSMVRYPIIYWNKLAVRMEFPAWQISTQHLDVLLWQLRHNSYNYAFPTLQFVSTQVGNYLRFFIAPFLILLAFIVSRTNVHLKLKTAFNMHSMKMAEKDNWPQITPVLKLDLIKEDIDEGPWAMAMTPMQFCKRNHLLKEKKDNRGKPAVDLIVDRAYHVFTAQLGPLWTHVLALPKHAKALFAIFAACGNHDREAAFE